ncbi:beta-lactamase family protein [Reichenbachiella agarivorans]|uniref:Beta-lactamase family protein n=1 Tax=Reichenbachiella agarivorans TaxID=2979464 RepID=A0ABY6CSP1_9BACT|nr:serine hydrolase [Reichenbachiella agarivorans]UXP33010.1 beta-lactamase family protein [Reichenbachiella agarivorans]
MKTYLLFFLLIWSEWSVYAQYAYQQPILLSDGWQVGDLRLVNQDTTHLYQFMNQLYRNEHEIHSIIIVQDGELILEDYYQNYQIDMQHDLRSVTKSVLALLTGIAIDQGFIQNEDEPVLKHLSGWQVKKNDDARKEQITIRDLLMMSSGLDCNDWDKSSKGQEDRVYRQKNWIQYTLDLPQRYNPGDTAMYCSMGTVLLAEVISQSSGLSIQEFASKYLFEPLGIKNASWDHTNGKSDVPNSAKRLYMTPRDMAKIGELILNNGRWHDQQIIPEEWIMRATSEQTRLTDIAYGYLWWILPIQRDELVYQTLSATGNGGQYIMVLPELQAVVVFTGGAYNSEADKLPFVILRDGIIPLISPHFK